MKNIKCVYLLLFCLLLTGCLNKSPMGEVVTARQIHAFRENLNKCWVNPNRLKGAKDMTVDIKTEIAPDGTVKKAEIVDKARMAQDSEYKEAAENARRAVLDPKCNPMPLPKEEYEQWKDLEISFNPNFD